MDKLASLSIVIPCHNEEEVIKNSYTILKKLLDKWVGVLISEYEIVMVNNGSSDDTLNEMLSLQKIDRNIVILDLRNNYGYQGSITAGLFNASKDMIVTIDSDLQDDPEKIEEMVKYYYDGYELVLGVRENRDSDSFLKKTLSEGYYWFLNKMGVNSVFNHGDFRLLSKNLLKELKRYRERNRYLRGLIVDLDLKYACVYYSRTKRDAGETKFTPSRLIALAIDGITSFSIKPIRLISLFGLFVFLLSIIGMLFVLYIKFIDGTTVPGWAFTSLTIMIFGGLQSLFIGIVGEYIAKTYFETKQRPMFLIRKKYKIK